MMWTFDNIREEWLSDTSTKLSLDEYIQKWYIAVYDDGLSFMGYQRQGNPACLTGYHFTV